MSNYISFMCNISQRGVRPMEKQDKANDKCNDSHASAPRNANQRAFYVSVHSLQ